jgi:hypothetical protein
VAVAGWSDAAGASAAAAASCSALAPVAMVSTRPFPTEKTTAAEVWLSPVV